MYDTPAQIVIAGQKKGVVIFRTRELTRTLLTAIFVMNVCLKKKGENAKY